MFFGEPPVNAEHTQRLFFGIFVRRMRRVTFLPQKFRRAQEQARSHLPSNDVAPLVDQQRQIAIRLDPIPVGVPDDGFRSWPHDQRLFQLFTAGVRDNSNFRCEALDMLRFFMKKAFGNEQWKIRVLVACVLEHGVQCLLHLLPDRVSVGTNDHAALDRRVIRQFGCGNHVGIPSGKVFAAFGDFCFGHNQGIIAAFQPRMTPIAPTALASFASFAASSKSLPISPESASEIGTCRSSQRPALRRERASEQRLWQIG